MDTVKTDRAFSFGKNWEEFVKKTFSDERVEISKAHILDFLGVKNLKDRYFIDAGCGSGLSSLAAFRSGAERILSFDADIYSVRTTEKLREMAGNPASWKILHGSVLDEKFIKGIEPADILYSWGVLHHTGNMNQAIRNAAGLVKENGLFCIAIYKNTDRSPYWTAVKKKYNASPAPVKRLMELKYIFTYTVLLNLARFKNPIKHIRNYQSLRGMSFYTDVKDWLGGYPYEDAKVEEIFRLCKNELSMELVNINTDQPVIEYLFRK